VVAEGDVGPCEAQGFTAAEAGAKQEHQQMFERVAGDELAELLLFVDGPRSDRVVGG
jgi:hypothetical protein